MMQTKQKVHIETWGCQMNVADSEDMLTLLEKKDYQLSKKVEDADLIILNTCHTVKVEPCNKVNINI